MKRALVLRAACAISGMVCLGSACSSSNPTLPPGATPIDSGLGERGIVYPPDTRPPASEAGGLDGEPTQDARDAARDIPLTTDAPVGIDGPLASKVTVTILSPAMVAGVDGGATSPVIAKSDRLAPTVQIEVQSRGGDPTLDSITLVKASLVSAGSKSPSGTINLNQTQYSVVPESGSKVYLYAETPFDLSTIAGDFYDLQVTATTAGGVAGTDSLRIYIDGGPVITFLQPAEAAYVKGSVVVTAMVVDNRASLAGVSFSIGQNAIAPIVNNGASQYSATVDFGSFNPPLDGLQIITITAVNANGNTSVATRKFTIDNAGPSITATKPGTGDMIGKVITIQAKVDDAAGVMKSSVIAVVAHGDVTFAVNLVQSADGTYRQLFDTTQLPVHAIFPSISFRAQDLLGNESSVGYLVSLDNTPPMMDLDPPDNFQLVKKDGTCSWPFDPVGPDAIDDGSTVTQLFDIRARIEDEGNKPLTGTADFVPIAAVDPASVKVLILDDTSLPVVVDTSDPPDGICDEVNPELAPSVSPQSSKDAQLIDMVSMPANAGAGDFTPLPGSTCSGNDANSPQPLCLTTYSSLKNQVMTYSLTYGPMLPSIWTIAPIVNDDVACAGRQFDASNHLSDGWACVAVAASDKLGNKQVSRPIRICVVATKDSTACTAAALGGSDLASVSLPSFSKGKTVVTTKVALTAGGAALKAGDKVIFSQVSPSPFSVINGTHTVSPSDTSGTRFDITDVATIPLTLYLDNLDTKPLVYKGDVALIAQDGAEIQVVTETPSTVVDPAFAGKVVLMSNGNAPQPDSRRWSIQDIQPTGFKLTGSTLKLAGAAIPSSAMPDCTGTVVKQTSGPVVDATKPCKPWASFPRYEALYLK